MLRRTGIWTCILLLWLGSTQPARADDYRVQTYVTGINIPWGMVWLPNGDMLVSERSGKLFRVRGTDIVAEIDGVPKVHANGQGGLLDLELHPSFATNGWIYFSYADASGWGSGSNTAIARARLGADRLTDLEVLYKASPDSRRGQHYGSRIEFDDAGYLYFSIGDRGARDDNPQDLRRDGGKVYRLFDDGRIPPDNPFASGARPAVYSYGHRNPQGMAKHPLTGKIWVHEHGPRGGDEVNLIKPAANYGWPILSHGVNYSGSSFAEGTEREGYESPVWFWVPSIAPSGMTFVTSDRYPEWQGHLLVGSLKFSRLDLCLLEGDRITAVRPVLQGIGRVRNVRQGPDGYIYVAVDGVGIKRVEGQP